ncbi:hypothetical protein ACFX2A_048177 [Malus domestica]
MHVLKLLVVMFKFEIKPRQPLKKLQVRFKIKCPPPLNQISSRLSLWKVPWRKPENPPAQFKNKLWKVNNLRKPENPLTQFKNKPVESQQLEETIKSSEPVQDQSCGNSTSTTKYVPIHPLPKQKIIYHMKLLVVQFQPSRSSLNGL